MIVKQKRLDNLICILAFFLCYEQPLVLGLGALVGFSDSSGLLHISALGLFLLLAMLVAFKVMSEKKLNRALVYALVLSAVLVSLYAGTQLFYISVPRSYRSYLLTLGSYVMPAIIAAALCAKNRDFLKIGKKLAFVAAVTLTICMAMAVFTKDLSVSVIYLNEDGLNYQTISYYSVYAVSLSLYLLTDKSEQISLLKKTLLMLMIFINLICAFAGGGRGAMVLLLVVGVYYIAFNFKELRQKKGFRRALVACVIVFIGLNIVMQMPIASKGIERTLRFFSALGSNIKVDNRNIRYALAIDSFWRSPIWGHGIGSVFMEVGFYSHNLFLDLLVEGGVLLLSAAGILLAYVTKKFMALRKNHPEFDLIAMIFLDCFVMYMFSGYYLSSAGLWFSIFYIFWKKEADYEKT